MQQLDLCEEIVKEMRKLEFSSDFIETFKLSSYFIDATNKPAPVQRTILSLYFYKCIIYSGIYAPPSVRMALTIGNDTHQWLIDIKLVILPVLKQNEELMLATMPTI
jgi:hypothetical protein